MKYLEEYTIRQEDEGIRLDRWFKRHRPDIPHALLQKLLRKKEVTLNGKKAATGARIQAGDTLRLPPIEKQEKAKRPTPELTEKDAAILKDNILYQDAHVIAINKPHGLAAQGGSGIRKSVDDLLDFLREGTPERPKLVHRIDKDTTGVMLLARDSATASELTQAFKAKTVKKTYLAIITGCPPSKEGTINAPLLAKKHNGKIEKAAIDDAGKPAITHYRVIDNAAKTVSLVELIPETGRMHQLRVHMAHIGHPILSDGKYGGKDAFLPNLAKKMHLHAYNIQYETLDITAPLPHHFAETMEQLGLSLK